MAEPQRTRRKPEPKAPDALAASGSISRVRTGAGDARGAGAARKETGVKGAASAEKDASCASRIPGSALPPIPGKRYFAIGEVADLCGVKAHVLRYWEQEFAELAPVKRAGNRRFYQHRDVLAIRRIRSLLYERGFTIEGARHQLASRDEKQDQAGSRLLIRQLVAELEELRRIL